MTALSVIQDVALAVGITKPTVVFTGTDREQLELASLAKECAQRIYKAHDWRLLVTLSTLTGDGSTTAFSLESDYGRMVQNMELWKSDLEAPLVHVTSMNKWLDLTVRSYDYVVGVWAKFGGQINIKPAMASGVTAKYYYISNLIVSPSAGNDKTAFTADDDTFRLDEELLKLRMIWKWRENKGLPYAEDMADYETLLAQLINEDKGSRMIRAGKARGPSGVRVAYPKEITA